MKYKPLFLSATTGLIVLLAPVALSQTIIYNNVPAPQPGNVPSIGFEATATNELGDGLIFTPGTPRLANTVTVLMSSWACTSGNWFNTCVTTPGATFNQPITLKIYARTGTTVGAVLTTVTQTFAIPYRPSSSALCSGGRWFNAADGTCYNGLANPITFNLSNLLLTLPDNVIVSVSFNTSDYGQTPQRPQPCNATVQGCPYDSLNVGTFTGPTVGAVVDPDGAFASYALPGSSCTGLLNPTFQLDTAPGCWTGFHPAIQVSAIPADVFQIRYASNLNIADPAINIINNGANGVALAGPGFGPNVGNICVNVYAFSPDEQLVSCCSCLITPNGLVSLSVLSDVVSNTLTGVRPNSVVVKLVNTGAGAGFTGATCTNSAALAGTAAFPIASGFDALGTTVHAGATGGFATTETPFLAATLSPLELASITNRCSNIIGNGSTFGICRSCRAGGLNAVKR